MAGTQAGGIAARDTNRTKYGQDFYSRIGAMGGVLGRTGGFASDKIGADGLTGRARASIVGTKGGQISRRSKKGV